MQCLLGRSVPRTRALVVVPTRELVQQVAAVFRTFTAGTPLTVVAITGHQQFTVEQEMLVPKGAWVCDVRPPVRFVPDAPFSPTPCSAQIAT